jgi:SNF family Na+-dependent transporter
VPLFHTDQLEAYRSDRWKNVVRQPLDTGAAFFTLSAPTFVLIQQASQLGTNKVSAQATLLAGLAVAAVAVAALVAYFIVRARGSLRRTAPT